MSREFGGVVTGRLGGFPSGRWCVWAQSGSSSSRPRGQRGRLPEARRLHRLHEDLHLGLLQGHACRRGEAFLARRDLLHAVVSGGVVFAATPMAASTRWSERAAGSRDATLNRHDDHRTSVGMIQMPMRLWRREPLPERVPTVVKRVGGPIRSGQVRWRIGLYWSVPVTVICNAMRMRLRHREMRQTPCP
jgi:hypothetical protein